MTYLVFTKITHMYPPEVKKLEEDKSTLMSVNRNDYDINPHLYSETHIIPY